MSGLVLTVLFSLSLFPRLSSRGLIMGVWNSHTSVGNILGTIIPSFWADCDGDNDAWGWAFLVPGFIIIFFGIVTYFFLVSDPEHVGLPSPVHHLVSAKTFCNERLTARDLICRGSGCSCVCNHACLGWEGGAGLR